MKNSLLLSAVGLLACACSPALVVEEGTLVSQQDVICTKEAPIGSHMPQKRCTTAAQREEQRKQAGDMTGNTGNKPPTGR